MIENLRLEDEGPDGMCLVIEGDIAVEVQEYLETASTVMRVRITPDALLQFDRDLRPWREFIAEGESVRAEYELHKRLGFCTAWVAGQGPCVLPADHEGDHDPKGAKLV